jgi:dolichyl-phosphate-mannose--protein O-mannosyl transferase
MSVDVALVQLALVFFPGIVWATLHRRFGVRTKVTNFDFSLQVFVFGVVAYAASYLGYWAIGSVHPLATALDDVATATDVVLAPFDVLVSVAVAGVLAVAFRFQRLGLDLFRKR